MARHLESAQCKAGVRRAQARMQQQAVAQALAGPTVFSIGGQQIESVDDFRCLVRVVAKDDSDLAACVRNVARACTKWAAISRILRRDGASVHQVSKFCMVTVSAVLLCGSETWVITRRIQSVLDAFHNRIARTIAGTHVRKLGGIQTGTTSGSALLSLRH
jgi:hypothetical protein